MPGNIKVNTNNQAIGLITLKPKDTLLCHSFIGFTIFNNDGGRYNLKPTFVNDLNTAIIKGITNSNNKYLDMKNLDLWEQHDYYSHSGWDGYITLNDKGVNYINSHAGDVAVRYVLVPRVISDQHNKNTCLLNVNTGMIKYYSKTSVTSSSIEYHLVDLKTKKSIIRRTLSDYKSSRHIHEPNDLSKLTEDDITIYKKLFLHEIIDDIEKVISGDNSF